MHYELYIDVFFLVNVTMDFFLLAAVRKMSGSRVSYRRIFLGALSGALLTCLIVVLPIPYASVKFILFHSLANAVMIKAGLGIKGKREFLQAFILLYIPIPWTVCTNRQCFLCTGGRELLYCVRHMEPDLLSGRA